MKCLPAPRRQFVAAALLLLLPLLLPFSADAQRQRRSGNPFQPPQAKRFYARSRAYDARHLRLVFIIDAANRSAQGLVTHTLAPLNDGLTVIVLDAGQNLQIESCRIHGQERPFTHEKDQLTIRPAAPLPRDKEITVEIRYRMPEGRVGGGANGRGGFYWILPDPERPERKPGFWTQGETETNRNWVPCYDFPNDFVTSETIVTVPEHWEVIGNGKLMGIQRNTAKKTRTFHWKMTQPHASYLLSLVGGELDIQRASWQGVPLYYVVPKGQAHLIDGSFGNTPDMLTFFSKLLGVKYPWPKYAQNAMIDFGGGMENVSATTLGAGALTDQRSGNYAMSGLNSHELAHQWFGDLVTCEDWGDSWLNESFATYFQQLYSEHFYGKDRFDLDRYGSLQSYLREAARYKRPLSTNLYASPDAMFDAHAYPKGALILHMLRRQLGDENFFRGLNRYLTVNRHKPVDTYDLQRALIDATGQNVKPFFDQWIFKPGHPVLETAWRYDEPGKAVVLTVKQTQDTAEDVPLYTLPLTIALLRQSSASAVERRQVTLDKAEQEFRLPVSEKPDAVLIDPDHDLLIELKAPKWTDEELPILLRSAPSALDRRAAANQMASGDSLSETAIQQLTAALPKEESEIVAEAILQRLGAARKEALRPLFRSEIKAKQPNRRAAALEALAKLPPQPEDIALFRTVGLSDTELYRNVETALKALGEANAAAHLDVFRKQVAARSHRDRLAATVVEILAPKKLDAAAPIFIEATAFTHRPETRRAAIRALGSLAPGSAPTRQTLVNLLKEQERPSIQQAAIRALEARKEKEAVAALRALAASAAKEEVRQSAAKAADAIEGKGG